MPGSPLSNILWMKTLQVMLIKIARVGIPPYFLAFGVTTGGGLLGALGLWLAGRGPQDPAVTAYPIRIWAVAIAIGGTFTALENLEKGFSSRALPLIIRDSLVIAMAYGGAQCGYWVLKWMTRR